MQVNPFERFISGPDYHGNTKQFGMYGKKKNQRQKRKLWRQNPDLRKK